VLYLFSNLFIYIFLQIKKTKPEFSKWFFCYLFLFKSPFFDLVWFDLHVLILKLRKCRWGIEMGPARPKHPSGRRQIRGFDPGIFWPDTMRFFLTPKVKILGFLGGRSTRLKLRVGDRGCPLCHSYSTNFRSCRIPDAPRCKCWRKSDAEPSMSESVPKPAVGFGPWSSADSLPSSEIASESVWKNGSAQAGDLWCAQRCRTGTALRLPCPLTGFHEAFLAG